MKIISVHSAVWADQANTAVILAISTEDFGLIQFSASPTDVEAYGRELFAQAVAGDFGPIAEYLPPVVPAVIPQEISKAQGIAALMERGYWPAVNSYLTTQAPPETLTLFNAVTVFNRTSPLLLQIQALLGISDADVNQMFIDGAQKVI